MARELVHHCSSRFNKGRYLCYNVQFIFEGPNIDRLLCIFLVSSNWWIQTNACKLIGKIIVCPNGNEIYIFRWFSFSVVWIWWLPTKGLVFRLILVIDISRNSLVNKKRGWGKWYKIIESSFRSTKKFVQSLNGETLGYFLISTQN